MVKQKRRTANDVDETLSGELIPAAGTPHCAHTRDDGTPCLNRPMANDTKCRFHSRKKHYKGVTDPNFTAPKLTDPNDRFVRNLPENMKQDYFDALNDPQLYSSQREIAMLELRIAQLQSRAAKGTGESATRWESLQELAMQLDALEAEGAELHRSGDVDGVARLKATHTAKYNLLKRMIVDGASAENAWDELKEATKDHAKLKESQTNRMVQMHQMMTLEQYAQFAASYMASLRRHVKDQSIIDKIAHEIQHPNDLTG